MHDRNITVFLEGKVVYLRTPEIDRDVLSGNWYSWFNDKAVTKYLNQGVFPNTPEKQVDFVNSLKDDISKLVLCIVEKKNTRLIGVIAFSNIDLLNRKAMISLVLGEKTYALGAPLEAMALMTEHGFDRLNLNKIDAAQCTGLWKWVNILALIGYRIEGYTESVSIRDGTIHDGVRTGITAKQFYDLRDRRGGNICTSDITSLLKQRNKVNNSKVLKDYLDDLNNSIISED